MIKRIFLLLLVCSWVGVIFYMSSQEGAVSKEQSLKVVNFITEIKKVNNVSINFNLKDIHYYVRKSGHVIEYFILSFLILLLTNSIKFSIKYKYIVALLFCEVFAILDEYYQEFVIGRDGNFKDVLIDNIGIFLGLIIYFFSIILMHSIHLRR